MEFVEAWPVKVNASKGGVGEQYLANFPPGKVPALERPNGFTLFECIPVATYCKILLLLCIRKRLTGHKPKLRFPVLL